MPAGIPQEGAVAIAGIPQVSAEKCPSRESEGRESEGRETEGQATVGLTRRWRERFPEFYEPYPKKVAKNDARAAWDKLKPATTEEIPGRMTCILALLKFRKLNDWSGRPDNGTQFPHPATFLRAESFDRADVEEVRAGKAKPV